MTARTKNLSFLKDIFYAKGVTQFKGNYVTNQAPTTTYTGTTATNDSVGSSTIHQVAVAPNNEGGGSGGGGGGGGYGY